MSPISSGSSNDEGRETWQVTREKKKEKKNCAMTSARPSRAEILKATTKEDLAAISDALLAWQEELTAKQQAANFFAQKSAATPATTTTALPTDVRATEPATEEETQRADSPGTLEDEFVLVDSKTLPAQKTQPQQQQQQPISALVLSVKTPLSCSEPGCARIVLRADASLHQCAVCRRVFCAEHSDRLAIAISGQTARALCEACHTLTCWAPGATTDRTADLRLARVRFVVRATEEATAWKGAVSQGLEAAMLYLGGAPAAQAIPTLQQQIPAVAIAGMVKGVVGNVFVPSHGQCAVCAQAFTRLSVRRTCALCRKDVCYACGVVDAELGVAMCTRILGKVPKASPASVKCCGLCNLMLAKERIAANLERERSATTVTQSQPEWLRRHDECVRLAEGIQAQMAVVLDDGGDAAGARE
jgi:hypothetical protein